MPTIIRVQLVPEHKYIFTVSFSTNHSLLSTCKNLRRSLTEFYWLQSNLKVKSWNKSGYITAILRKGSKMLQLCLWNLSCGCPVTDREYQLWRDFSQDSSQTRSWWMMRWIQATTKSQIQLYWWLLSTPSSPQWFKLYSTAADSIL